MPARMPASVTFQKRMLCTPMPDVSEALGFSPTDRVRRPHRVLKRSTHSTSGMISAA